MKKLRLLTCILLILVLTLFTACGKEDTPNWGTGTEGSGTEESGKGSGNESSDSSSETQEPVDLDDLGIDIEVGGWDDGSKFAELSSSNITLSDSGSSADTENVTIDGNTVTITEEGVYIVSGTLSEGSLIVNAPDSHVELILDNASVSSADGSPLQVLDADKVVLWLSEGSDNTFTCTLADSGEDTSSETEDADGESASGAAIFSKDDLTVNGSGSLTLSSEQNGITCKNELKLVSGTVTVNAGNNGLRGKDCVAVFGGTVTVTAGNDGIKSVTASEETEGYVYICGGTVEITAEGDGLHGEALVLVAGGDLAVTTGGGSESTSTARSNNSARGWFDFDSSSGSSGDSVSQKGLKSDTLIQIEGGTVTVDSADDALHSDNTLVINDGTLTLASGDDGMHADTEIDINGGTYVITASYEGIEAVAVNIAGGDGALTSEDDGINANGGDSMNPMAASSSSFLTISGGRLYINADGDGVDSNGSISMTGGTVLVEGPTDSANGAIDYGSSFTMTGGTIIAVGSSGMAESVTASGCYAVQIYFSQNMSAGLALHIEDADGNDILTMVPTKTYSNLVICSPDISTGDYILSIGGTLSGGESWYSLYTGASIENQGDLCTFTVSEENTSISSDGSSYSGGGMGGMGGHGGNGGGRGMR